MGQSASLHGQIGFAPWPNRLHSMVKSASPNGQTESRPCTKKGFGVIIAVLWRQLITVLASNYDSIDANTNGWPQEKKGLATGGIRLATGGFKVDHRTDRTLIGAGKDFATLRKGFAPLTERFGVLGISVIKAVLTRHKTSGVNPPHAQGNRSRPLSRCVRPRTSRSPPCP